MIKENIIGEEDIVAKFRNTLMKNIKVSSEFIRQNSGIIIAASLSMIIFLLTLITERTLFLDIGISFLVISIIFQYELFHQSTKISTNQEESQDETSLIITIKKLRNQTFLQIFGSTSFFIALLFLFSHFQIFYVSLGLMVYLNFKCLRRIILSIRYLKEIKEFGFKKLTIGPEIIKHFKIIILFAIVLEIIIIICTVLISFNWIWILFGFI